METLKLLLIDDEIEIINALTRLIKTFDLPLDVHSFNDPQVALLSLNDHVYDIILTDQRMPNITGLSVIKQAKKVNPLIQNILMSGYSDFDIIISGINDGHIAGFIMKPWKQNEVYDIIKRAIQLKLERDMVTYLEQVKLTHINDWKRVVERFQFDEVDLYKRQLNALALLIKAKDLDLYEHSIRVGKISRKLGVALSFSKGQLDQLECAALVHDLGKIVIRDSINYKEGKLSEDEYAEMKRHPEIGREILEALEIERQVIKMVSQHHERVDGKGYPEGLKNDEIIVEAKVLAIADAFDAITSDRVYRKGLPVNEALEIIKNNVGLIYDASVFNALHEILLTDIELGD